MATEKYTEILKLKRMLEEAGIPFEFTDDLLDAKEKIKKCSPREKNLYRVQYPAYQIRIGDFADAIQHYFSYGANEANLLEIMGALTEEEMAYDSVLGWLTAEEVFKRFKYCWEHQTSTYKEEENND